LRTEWVDKLKILFLALFFVSMVDYEKKVYTVMVNNSTNMKKMNNQPSPEIIEPRPRHMTLEIQVLTWDRHKNVDV
jgi:hypothetical protein